MLLSVLRNSGWTGGRVSMALPVLSKVLEVMLEPEDAPPLFLELFKGFEFTDAELQALNAVCKQYILLLTSRPAVDLSASCRS